jgi:hypothetical protein
MNIEMFEIQGLVLFEPARHGDARGFFSEVFRKDVFAAHAGPGPTLSGAAQGAGEARSRWPWRGARCGCGR